MIVPLKADDDDGGGHFYEPASKSDFDKYQTLTIDHDQVNSDLTNFPVLVYNSSWVAGLNETTFSFFDSDNTTECNWELEKYDSGTGELVAWVNVTSVASGSDTTFYLYYDESSSTDGGEHNPTDTWDSDFFAVFHGRDLNDSTTNGYLLSRNQSATEDAEGKISGCFDLENDGSGNPNPAEYFYNLSFEDITSYSNLTISCWMNMESVENSPGPRHSGITFAIDTGSTKQVYLKKRTLNGYFCTGIDDGDTGIITGEAGDYDTDTWYHHVGTVDETTTATLYQNGIKLIQSHDTAIDYTNLTDRNIYIGYEPVNGNEYDGKIDEIRISKTNRSQAWISTEYNNMENKTDGGFITFGSAEDAGSEDESSYSIKGLANNKITWAGVAGNTVYCNETGDGNQWLEINMSINASQNVTGIRVFMDDLNDTGDDIGAGNITLYVSSDNSSYGSLGSFINGGSNITINATTWSGDAGTNPFTAGAGLTDKNASIWCIFTLAIPIGAPTDLFYSEASDSCKVYIGHYT